MTYEDGIDFKRRRLAALQAEVDRLDALEELDFRDGDVIRYQQKHGRRLFTYVATRIDMGDGTSNWFVTGTKNRGSYLTDSDFFLNVLSKVNLETIEVAHHWHGVNEITEARARDAKVEAEAVDQSFGSLFSAMFGDDTEKADGAEKAD